MSQKRWRVRMPLLPGTTVTAPSATFHGASPPCSDSHAARLLPSNSTTASDGAAPMGVATTAGTGVQASVFSGSADGSWASAAALVNMPPVSRSMRAAMRWRGKE